MAGVISNIASALERKSDNFVPSAAKEDRPFVFSDLLQASDNGPSLPSLISAWEKATNDYNAAMMIVLQAEDAADQKLKALSAAQAAIDNWYAERQKNSPKGSTWGPPK